MDDFMGGALTFGYVLASLFFLRFWTMTKDRLFAAFSASFALLAVNRAALVFLRVGNEHLHYIYVIRLVAFLLILYAIIDKNRVKPRSPDGTRPSDAPG